VRRAARHFARYDTDYYLVLSGDQLYRMDYGQMVDAHVDGRADLTIAAQPVTTEDASSMGVFRFDRGGQIAAFEEKPTPERLREMGQSIPAGALVGQRTPAKPFVASMGVYLFSRDVLLELLEAGASKDFGREIIPLALGRYRVNPYLFRDYWVDVGTVGSFYDANIMLTWRDPPFQFYDAERPIYTHPRFLPGARLSDCSIRDVIITEGCQLDRCTVEDSVVGIRARIQQGATVRRSVLLGADFYESDGNAPRRLDAPPLGIGRDVVLDRVIVDKNARIGDGARLVNEAQVQEADGPGYYIREGIIVVPKDGVIQPGTIV
jgi:glucose-1-phosphate adenylyltransferase